MKGIIEKFKNMIAARKDNEAIWYLKENDERAKTIIEAAFPGMRLGKYRSDRGVKKIKGIKHVRPLGDPEVGKLLNEYPKAGE